MVAVPAFVPVTSPDTGFTVTLLLGLLHTPPGGVLVSVTVSFLHTSVGPTSAVGSAYTVTVVMLRQVVGRV
jgi:hypothetical protein